MILRKLHILIVLITGILMLFMFSCSGPQTIQKMDRNMADIYNPSRSSLHPDFNIHHINDSNTVAYIRIYPSELLFNQANEMGEYLAFLDIRYYLFEIGDNNNFVEVS
ncbi:MAG: hypothetical protein ACOCWA_09650, partial [Bacteroidota bacterium]